MRAEELIANYTPVGDTIAILICITLWIVIKTNMSFSKDYGLKLHKRAILLVFVASISNIAFFHIIKYSEDLIVLIYLTKAIYHAALLSALFVFIIYVRNMLSLPREKTIKLTVACRVIVVAGILCECFSFYTRWGLYYQGNGLWHDYHYIKPYILIYIFCMLVMATLLIVYRNRMIAQVQMSLVMLEILCGIILVLQVLFRTNSYTTITFLLPMLELLITVHGLPYEKNTGAQNAQALDVYIKRAYKEKSDQILMVLKLYISNKEELPLELGRKLDNFYNKYLDKAALFKLDHNTYVLMVPQGEKKKQNLEIIESLIEQQFQTQYENYTIPYRVMVLTDVGFIEDASAAVAVIGHFESLMGMNEVFYSSIEDMQQVHNLQYIINQLREIDAKKDLDDERVLCYMQPVKNVKTNSYDTAEALMRLKLSEIGMVFPDVFIPVAEQNNLIHTLGLIMLNKVCQQLKELESQGIPMKRISVNFTLSEFHEELFVEEIVDIIAKNQVPYDKIAIELTESQTDEDYEVILERIAQLRQYGIVFYLDDFGTGYTNFDRVLQMNLDIVKFDRSLLLSANENKTNAFILQHFAEAFEKLDYQILFEGIESKDQENLCNRSHADYLQGYMYSKPIPREELADFLRENA